MWRPRGRGESLLEEKQSGSDVGEEQSRRKESAAVNLGTSAGHGILGEHMWAWDKGIERC